MMIEKSIDLDGRRLSFQIGKVARQAHGSVWARFEDTVILAAVCAETKPRLGQDFFPLQVEYREKLYSAGRFPGGFFKREARPAESEVLNSRLIDRPLRPLFDEGFSNETQIHATVFSYDRSCDPGPLACCAASLALCASPIPFRRLVGSVQVARIHGEPVVNPSLDQLAMSDVEMVVAATKESITMVEGESGEISESEMLELIRFAHERIRRIIALQEEVLAELGAIEKWPVTPPEVDEALKAAFETAARPEMTRLCAIADKTERNAAYDALKTSLLAPYVEAAEGGAAEALKALDEAKALVGKVLHDQMGEVMRQAIVEQGRRLDGRGTAEIRPITCEVDVLPRTHGSALFTRGQTQSLGTVTLGTGQDAQRMDGIWGEKSRNFMLHYNFPPYSVGEVRRLGSTGRREIGHGNLAERALKGQVIRDSFPYTIRIVSEILESNGSSSMASVCSGTLAMMAAGVPMHKPVAGIAMGLVMENNKVAVLSDILGDEDHLGDMDFKVCGTRDGITSFQMDIKIDGLSFEIMERALLQAKEGRLHILGKMAECLAASRPELSPFAPRLEAVVVPVDKIGMIIGPGGKMVREIQESTKTKIDIADDGTITIASENNENLMRAVNWIRDMVAEAEVGKVYTGKIVSIVEFGAFVEIMPGKEGLLHISEIDWARTERVEDVLKVGDKIEVLLQSAENNKLSLSRRALLPKPEGYVERPRPPRPEGDRGRGGDRGGRGGGDRGRGGSGGGGGRRY
ncbi:MAG: polyribonucleotide nucleotidyltransferase [bacterium]|jgi:polyribonucleotide nucleotidyltransferase|nr:polyribonucleotide nucleotidyltransferase [bacterium]